MRVIAAGMLLLIWSVSASAADDETLAWESRAIIGWHQAGASSAESSQHLFIDFFVARPLGDKAAVFGNSVNLWGQVRVASAPQQRNIPLSQFAAGFVGELGKVPVNELAQSAEFLTGIEIRPKKLKWGDDNSERVRTLGFVGFFGANGAFKDPVTDVRIFRIPSVSSPQWPNFVAQFPDFADATFRANAPFLGLVPPDRERFYRQYGFGLRYASYVRAHSDYAPAMYTATIGQDQSITHGRYVGPVIKLDAFYPLSIKKTSFLYLFGTANLAAAKPIDRTPLALQLVSQACETTTGQGTSCGVSASQDNVAIRAVASSRDTYRIGVGIDAISFIKYLIEPKPKAP